MKNLKRGMILFLVLLLAGCGNTDDDAERKLRIAFIAKDLEHYWFQREKEGMEKKCMELGIRVDSYDAYYDDEKCMDLVESIIRDQYDGLVICTTNQELGPGIGKLCQEAELPVVTIDDSMVDAEGREFPLVSMACKEVGGIGGVALSRLASEAGFPEDRSQVRIVEMDVPTLSVFRERLTGYEEALFSLLGLSEEQVTIIAGDTGMYVDNCQKIREYFRTEPPDSKCFWIVCGVNDDCALAPMHMLAEFGVPCEQVIACGLGGYELSVQEFQKNNRHYITVMTQPDVEGEQAVEMLYYHIAEGVELKDSVVLGGAVATCDNYLLYFGDEVKVTE